MSLIVETGAGLSTAESYISVADADAYFAARNLTLWADAGFTTAEKEGCLRRATDYMEQQYRERWTGERRTTTQALSWPRIDVPWLLGNYFPIDAVPAEVSRACAELAWRAAFGELTPDAGPQVTQETVGPITVQYAPGARQQSSFTAVEGMLRHFFGSSAAMVRVLRA